MPITQTESLLDAHVNVQWLRPESALWDAIASSVIAHAELPAPSLDLGAGNGVFSFLTAGGRFSAEYDWYRNVRADAVTAQEDPYDAFEAGPTAGMILEAPAYRFDVALDRKANLLRQAEALGMYRKTIAADANQRLPFADGAFQTVFSNMLYWLDSPERALQDVRRILRPQGRAVLCLPDPRFLEACASYRWREERSSLLQLVNRARSESIRWTLSSRALAELATRTGFTVVSDTRYLTPLTLKVWDIGLRPLFPVLMKMVARLTEADRLAIKAEWIELVRPFLQELYAMERESHEAGGYHCVELEKTGDACF